MDSTPPPPPPKAVSIQRPRSWSTVSTMRLSIHLTSLKPDNSPYSGRRIEVLLYSSSRVLIYNSSQVLRQWLVAHIWKHPRPSCCWSPASKRGKSQWRNHSFVQFSRFFLYRSWISTAKRNLVSRGCISSPSTKTPSEIRRQPGVRELKFHSYLGETGR